MKQNSGNDFLPQPLPSAEGTVEFTAMVSVLIPAHNAACFLSRAIASVQMQSFSDWEVIVVDDGSSDNTLEIAQSIAALEPRVRIFQHSVGQGAGPARNTALKIARGRYIAFLDADDEWEPAKLERQLAYMKKQNAGLSYTGYWRSTGKRQRRVHVPERVTYKKLIAWNCIGCLTAIYDRKQFGSVPMPDLPLRQDFALWLDLLEKGGHAFGLNEPLATYHTTQGSISSNKFKATKSTWRLYREHLKFGRLRAAFYVSSHNLNRVLRG